MSIRTVKGKKGTSYRAEARINGIRKTKTFASKTEAQRWEYETLQQLADVTDEGALSVTVGDAIARYMKDVAPKKRGAKWELARGNVFQRSFIAQIPVMDLKHSHGCAYRDQMVDRGLAPNTVIREMGLLKVIVRHCTDWYDLPYPWERVKMPKAGAPRSRLITDEEVERIVHASGYRDDKVPKGIYQFTGAAFLFAIETALRMGEIASIRPDNIDMKNSVINLDRDGKDRHKTVSYKRGRVIPLGLRAKEILESLDIHKPHEGIFNDMSAAVISATFARIRNQAGMPNGDNGGFTFHDTRHLACTRLSRVPGMSVLKLAAITGHKDPKMLKRYYNEDMMLVADDLQRNEARWRDENQALVQELTKAGYTIDQLKKVIHKLESGEG